MERVVPKRPRGKRKLHPSSTKAQPASLYSDRDWQRERPTERSADALYRSEARRDVARLLHSAAFRRLQGKTQLFPGSESDFFRNRLTHSLEVAQIAESIAYRINYEDERFEHDPIDTDLVKFAGLAHDLGHPPFGHNGEMALDKRMEESGGFEGNAQTLRIVSRIEKKSTRPSDSMPDGFSGKNVDERLGLNLSYRSLASILKYCKEIPPERNEDKNLVKGYYGSEGSLVKKIIDEVAPNFSGENFKTIECQIMDLADDIAYSTYDLEDSFKAGFLDPMAILGSDKELLERVAEKISHQIGENPLNACDITEILNEIFGPILIPDDGNSSNVEDEEKLLTKIICAFTRSQERASVGYWRTQLTSDLISDFIAGVKWEWNEKNPSLSKVWLDNKTLRKVEVLKNYTYQATILSSRLKVVEYRGKQIVDDIFSVLTSADGHLLLPDDVKRTYLRCSEEVVKKRIICDFIAGMTDRYALEFHSRMYGDNEQSMFKPM